MKNNNKRIIYIVLFIVLGILLGLIVHGLVEMWYISGLLSDFPKYSLGYDWATWFTIHRYFSLATLVLGIIFGYFEGKFWWRLVYEEKKLDPFFRRLKKLIHW